MMGKLGQSVYHVGFQATASCSRSPKLVIGWRLVVNAEVARGKLAAASVSDRASTGQAGGGAWYARNVCRASG